jgi:uncharacterized protein YeaO (DUF488 family)
MLELYTSQWKNQNLANLDVVPVGISRGTLPGLTRRKAPYRYKRLMDLAPSSELFGRWKVGDITPEEYTIAYRDYLNSLGAEEVIGQLERKSVENEGKPLALLCFCAPGAFCHRRVLAAWYQEKTGQAIPELTEAAREAA